MTNDDIEKALKWLIDNATAAAEARADRLNLEAYNKVVKAQCMVKHQGISMSQAEAYALVDAEYLEQLKVYKEAVLRDERMRYLKEAAHAKIDVFRSLEATKRALGI